MDYERGLDQLKSLAKGTDWLEEFLIYESRLRDNLRDERRYGTTELSRAIRAQILDQLNHLVLKHSEQAGGVSFNDLCSNSQKPHIPSSVEIATTTNIFLNIITIYQRWIRH